jgi:hypothetical protein
MRTREFFRVGGMAAATLVSALTPAIVKAEPTPRYTLAVHAIALNDDDGTHAATVTGASVATLIAQTNQVFVGTGIQFTFDPVADFETRNKTSLNRLTNGGGDFWSEGNAIAATMPDKVVIFFRWGPDPAARSGWAFAYPPNFGGGQPDSPLPTPDVHFVAYMSDGAAGGNGLGHELGHYLGLYHTFPGWGDSLTATLAQVSTRLQNAGDLSGLDGDGLSDTPPDAGRTFYTKQRGQQQSL